MITAISPIDGRYAQKVDSLIECFSEYALIKNRVIVEICWLKALSNEKDVQECRILNKEEELQLNNIINNFDIVEAEKVKEIEKKQIMT